MNSNDNTASLDQNTLFDPVASPRAVPFGTILHPGVFCMEHLSENLLSASGNIRH